MKKQRHSSCLDEEGIEGKKTRNTTSVASVPILPGKAHIYRQEHTAYCSYYSESIRICKVTKA